MRDKATDWLDETMAQVPQWEPPSGFALRVTAAARQRRAAPEPPVRRERLLLAGWWRVLLTEIVTARAENSLWILRQYLSVLRR